MGDSDMHFEGDTCTLSFGLHTRMNRVQLLGTLWPLDSSNPQYDSVRPAVRFSTLFSEADIESLHRWLLSGAHGDIVLPEPLQLARRLSPADSALLSFEIQFGLPEIPDWWHWDTSFPLRVHVDVRQREFSFLVQSLDRQYWFDN